MRIWHWLWQAKRQAAESKEIKKANFQTSCNMDNTKKENPHHGEVRGNQTSLSTKDSDKSMEKIANDVQYLRIGTDYYKRCKMPQLDGGMEEVLLPWTRETIKEDTNDKYYFESIPKYKGFCLHPSHTEYKEVIDGWINLYKPIPAQPKEGGIDKTMKFLTHIFGEQLLLGLDYLQLLYLNPIQKLPNLLLVSKERCTGKTTFLNFLNLLFGENVTFNTNEEFRDRFNSSWAGKLIVCIDEALLNKVEDAQLIKNLSTAKKIKLESKGKDKMLVDFFGKFVMASNNESNPVYIEPGEVRYWVRKIPVLEQDNVNLLEELKHEVPAFLHFLQHRPMATKRESRMWFNPQLILTEEFKKIANFHADPLEVEIKEVLLDIMERENVDRVNFSNRSMVELLDSRKYKTTTLDVRRIVGAHGKWKLSAQNASSHRDYKFFQPSTGRYAYDTAEERFYIVTKDFLENL